MLKNLNVEKLHAGEPHPILFVNVPMYNVVPMYILYRIHNSLFLPVLTFLQCVTYKSRLNAHLYIYKKQWSILF